MIWLQATEVAKLMAYDISSIQKKCKLGDFGSKGYGYRYVSGSKGQGGKCLQIALEALPERVQMAYHKQCDETVPFYNEAIFTAAQRDRAAHKKKTVKRYEKFCKEQKAIGRGKGDIMNDFISRYNADNSTQSITAKTLYEWISKAHSGDPYALIDGRGGYNRGSTSIDAELWTYFKSFYLRLSKPTLNDCYRITRLEADRRGIVVPGRKAFEIAVRNIPYGELALFRDGPKVFDDKYLPYVERDYGQLKPNEQWVSDHHLWDVFVRVQDGNGGWRAERPWGSYWMDMCTRKVLCHLLRVENPNSDGVICSFGEGVKHFGIPESVLLDNGKDYKANDLFSKQDEEVISSNLQVNLDIKTVYAIPYNAKAKPIERLFETFESQFGKRFPTYAGSNAKERPELLKDLPIMEYPTLEEFTELHNKFVYDIYNNTPHSGDGLDNLSPNMAYASKPFVVRKMAAEVLQLCLMRVKGKRTVQRNGVTFNDEHYYMGENNINYVGKKVLARYSPFEPKKLYIYDLNDNFITIANKVEKKGFNSAVIDFAQIGKMKKDARAAAMRKHTKLPPQNVKTTIVQQAQLAAQSAPEPVLQQAVEIVRNAKMEENARRIAMSDADRQYQDNLTKQAMESTVADKRKQQLLEKFTQQMLSGQNLKEAASR